MKEIIRYACDFCGTEYNSEGEARLCELSHNEPVEFDGKEWMFGKKYPEKLTVRMKDGSKCRYEFLREMKGSENV